MLVFDYNTESLDLGLFSGDKEFYRIKKLRIIKIKVLPYLSMMLAYIAISS